ncbi:hypothetical protein ACUNWD_11170 [Sunxiuqinia sp. A32]|uniref:hypothetical protein n=1 Tax=Sunxiuqinia sp. A32 TaxID=3461496 RepID=UPI004045B70A
MLQKSLAAFIILFFSLTVTAQQAFQWGIQAGSTVDDRVAGIISVKNGVVVAGSFAYSIECKKKIAEGMGKYDIFVMKVDKDGRPDWIRSLGGEAVDEGTCMAADQDQVLVGGKIEGNISFEKEQFEGEGSALVLSSWDMTGKLNWLTRLPYTGGATMDVIQLMPDGSIMIGGMLQGTIDTGSDLLETPRRKLAWQVNLTPGGKPKSGILSSGSGIHRLVGSVIDRENCQYLAYSTSGGMSFGNSNTVGVKRGTKEAVIVKKQDSQGNFLWGKAFSGSEYCEFAGMDIGNDNELQLAVNYSEELHTTDTLLNCSSLYHMAVFSLDDQGETNWLKTISSPLSCKGMDLMVDKAGGTLIGGLFRTAFVVDDLNYDRANGASSLFLLQFDRQGELNWYSAPASGATNYCSDFTLDEEGNILLTGVFLDELTIDGEVLKTYGKRDVFIARYFNCGQLEMGIKGDGPLCENEPRTLSASPGFESYIWNDTEWGSNSYEITTPGTYWVTAYTKQGCAAHDTVTVELASEMELGLDSLVILTPGNTHTLSANGGFAYYKWDDGVIDSQRDIKYQENTDSQYMYLTAQTEFGCEVADSVFVQYEAAQKRSSLNGLYGLTVYPNPVKDFLYWKSAMSDDGELEVILYDGKSTQLYREEITDHYRWQEHSVDMTAYPPGQYTFTLKTKVASYAEKIIKVD